MKSIIILVLSVFLTISMQATGKAKWAYLGDHGVHSWATLSPDNFACAGKNQSPINLSGFLEAELAPIEFKYIKGGHEILNNGHTVQINYAAGSAIVIDDLSFSLLQFHFHAPSENHINGQSFPMEVHFVHADDLGNLAVIAVMFKEGDENAALTSAWSVMPKHAGEQYTLAKMMNAESVLPESKQYYRFNGSLTTPPCSEGVRWLVMKEAVTASKAQIDAFASALHEPNNRPLQAINARTILR